MSIGHTDEGPHTGINLALIYEDLSTVLWAAESLPVLLLPDPGQPKFLVTPVCFLKLEDSRYRDSATAVAIQADLILIATSSGRTLLPEFVESWLEECLQAQSSAISTVATLFSSSGRPDPSDSPRLQVVQRIANKAGRGFFALNVDEMTPILA